MVLSGSIGAGHDSVAEACSGALATAGIAATTVDCMAMMGGIAQRVGDRVFQTMLRSAPVFDAFHFSQLRAGSRLARVMESAAAGRLVPAVSQLLPPDHGGLVLGVFATGAGTAARLRARRPDWRAAVFCTDAAAHRMWVQDGIDRYFVCSPAAAGTVRQYDAGADVVELPPPVRPEFYAAPPRDLARRSLGIDPETPTVLLIGGGWGRGPLDDCARALADAGYHVLVVAGSNKRLEQRLAAMTAARRPGDRGAVTVFGFVPQMPSLMSAADVVVTSPGQTCHEARVVGRPLVLLDIVPGHGRENLLAELAVGGAIAALPDPSLVVRSVGAVVGDRVIAPSPWPVRTAIEWQKRFIDKIEDLLPAEQAFDEAPS
jgi:UDP-N-acetylglucosamine:LPS N-acetylglucosamine transferase